jgi:hypothetical protein
MDSQVPKKVARPAGFEPATCGFEVRRSIRAELRAHMGKTGLLIGNRPLIVKGLSKSAWDMGHRVKFRNSSFEIRNYRLCRLSSDFCPLTSDHSVAYLTFSGHAHPLVFTPHRLLFIAYRLLLSICHYVLLD